jgi:hypothetical protein
MDAISKVTDSSAWSHDPELMQKLDETYRKHLGPHTDSDESRNSSPSGLGVVLFRTRWYLLRTLPGLGVGSILQLPRSITRV